MIFAPIKLLVNCGFLAALVLSSSYVGARMEDRRHAGEEVWSVAAIEQVITVDFPHDLKGAATAAFSRFTSQASAASSSDISSAPTHTGSSAQVPAGCLVIDFSPSNSGSPLASASDPTGVRVTAAQDFIASLPAEFELRVWGFNDQAWPIVQPVGWSGSQRSGIIASLSSTQAGGSATNIFAGLSACATQAAADPEGHLAFILLLSDLGAYGEGDPSQTQEGQLAAIRSKLLPALQAAQVPAYIVGYSVAPGDGDIFEELAQATGGVYWSVQPDALASLVPDVQKRITDAVAAAAQVAITPQAKQPASARATQIAPDVPSTEVVSDQRTNNVWSSVLIAAGLVGALAVTWSLRRQAVAALASAASLADSVLGGMGVLPIALSWPSLGGRAQIPKKAATHQTPSAPARSSIEVAVRAGHRESRVRPSRWPDLTVALEPDLKPSRLDRASRPALVLVEDRETALVKAFDPAQMTLLVTLAPGADAVVSTSCGSWSLSSSRAAVPAKNAEGGR